MMRMMRLRVMTVVRAGFLFVLVVGSAAAQEHESMQHEHMAMQGLPAPFRPKLGILPAEAAKTALSLDQVEERAKRGNPTLAQAEAEVRAVEGRRVQAGLWPNPTVGYVGEEIRGGSFRGGEQGFFVEQNIVLGGKLGLDRKVIGHQVTQAQAEAEEQRLRVVSNVRALFYKALAAQEMWNMRRELTLVARGTAEFKRQLFNTGQQNESEVLQAEIEAEQAELDEIAAEHTRKRTMRMLAAVSGDALVSQAWLAGDLEGHAPEIAEESFMDSLLRESPAVKIARASLDEAEASAVRARREAIPDLFVRGGLQQNRELLEATGRSVGLQGFAEVGVQLRLFNRNQGGVRAAEAEVERARKEVQRVELALREHAAGFLENYETAQVTVGRYRERLLPRAQRAYELLYAGHERVQASWPQVLGAQKMLLELEDEYIKSLERVWVNTVGLENFLLTDGLEAPARAQDMDRAVREVNVPEMSGAVAVRER